MSSPKEFVLSCISRQASFPSLTQDSPVTPQEEQNWGLWLITVRMKLHFLSYSNMLFKIILLQSSHIERLHI